MAIDNFEKLRAVDRNYQRSTSSCLIIILIINRHLVIDQSEVEGGQATDPFFVFFVLRYQVRILILLPAHSHTYSYWYLIQRQLP